MEQMQAQVRGIDSAYQEGLRSALATCCRRRSSLSGGAEWTSGLPWAALLLGVAVAIALLAALFFDRFDPARVLAEAKKARDQAAENGDDLGGIPVEARLPQCN